MAKRPLGQGNGHLASDEKPAYVPDYTRPDWVRSIAQWHLSEAAGCRRANGPSSPEYAEMHETTAQMLIALLEKATTAS